jgi:uncharacterized protein YbjT (DUF2867 family)
VILVTGATGNIGSALVHDLVGRGVAVRAVARRPAEQIRPTGVEFVSVDLSDPRALMPVLTDVDKVFLLGGFAAPELLAQFRAADVERVVLLTSRCVIGGRSDNAITRMWLDAEAAVKESKIAWTILRPSGFQSNVLRWLPQLRDGDVVRAPWPDVPIAAIDPADIAAVAATVLTEPGHEETAPALSGPQPLTPGEQVATLARVLERPLRYEPLSDEHARVAMREDTPPDFIDAFFRFFSDGEFDDSGVVDSVHRITGHHPRPFEQWVRAHAEAFAPEP